ncbi:MAG: hypothetical protein RR192_00390, partial [Peptostreptococcaceae bacterium]
MINVIASNNINIGKVNKFDQHDSDNNLKLFNIIESQREKMKKEAMPIGNSPSSIIDYSPVNSYTAQDVIKRGKRLKKAVNDGWIYYADTETLGNPVSMNKPGTSPELNKLNNDIFTVNEVAVLKQQFKGGKPVGEPISVFNMTSTRTDKEMRVFASRVANRSDVDSTSLSTIKRFAGYNDKKVGRERIKAFSGGRVVNFNNEANIMDENEIAGGIVNLSENAQYTVGTDEYNNKVKDIYDEFLRISNSEDSVLATMNGDAFDMNVFIGMFEQAGLNVSEPVINQLKDGHIDMQKLMTSTIKEDIFDAQKKRVKQLIEDGDRLTKSGSLEEASELYEKANSIKHNMTNSNIVEAANGNGHDVKIDNPHIAFDDTIGTAKATNAFIPNIMDKIEKVEEEMVSNKISNTDDVSYNAINAVMAKEGDTFFSKEYNSPNSYNPVLMEPGHSYSIQSLTMDGDDIPEEYRNKKMVKITDLAEDVDRESWIMLNSDDEIKERLLDSKNVTMTKMNAVNQEIIDSTTRASIIDKARVEKTNFYKVNSDKGFTSFEMYQDMFNEYNEKFEMPTYEHLEAAIKNGGMFSSFDGEFDVPVSKAIPSLASVGQEDGFINERVRNLLSFYDDFDNNRNTYGRMRSAVNNIVGDNNSVASSYNINPNSKVVQPISKRAKTSTFASIKNGLEDRIYDDLSEDQILRSYIKSNTDMQKAFNNKVLAAKKTRAKRKGISHNKVKMTKEELSGIRKDIFSRFNGEEFSKDSDNIRDFVFGFKDVEENFKTINGLDIVGSDGSYKRLQMTNKEKFMDDLHSAIYSNTSSNKKAPANNRVRSNYIDEIARDLANRKIINQETVSKINSANTVASQINLLGNSVYSGKEKVYGLIEKASGSNNAESAIINKTIDYSNLNKKERKLVKRFLSGQKQRTIKNQPNGLTVLGESFDKFLGKNYKGKIDTLFNSISSNSNVSVPEVVTLVGDISKSNSKDVIKNRMKKTMMDNYNWTESNFENFFEKVINNKSNGQFKYSNGSEVEGGMTNHIVDIDGNGYLISTPKDKERRVIDSIINGTDIEEIKKNAGVFALPKVDEINGVKAIKQSDKSYKAVTNNITVKRTKRVSGNASDIDYGDIAVYDFEDTVDEVINKLSSNMRYAKSHMENRNMEKANSTLNGAWRAIHEDKTLNAISAKAVPDGEGSYVIKKTLGINRSDYALNTMTDMSDLIYSLDTVLAGNEDLVNSFDMAHGGSDAREILVSKIKNHKSDWYNKGEKLKFEGLDLSTKTWFTDNISTIADTILKNDHISKYSNIEFNKFMTGVLNVGINGFYTKESGEATRGFYNLLSPDRLNAGSLYSGVSRPLINQTLSATDINEESMLLLAKDHLPNDIMSGVQNSEQLMERIGVKRSISYMTEHGENVANIANGIEGKGMIGMSTTVKYMSPDEFVGNINILKTIDKDSEIAKEVSSNLKNRGINASIEDIKKAATAIGDVTNLYEDSGAVNPILASIMSPKTVVEQKIEMNNKSFKVNGNLKSGTIIGHKNGKPIRYKGQDAKIVNSETGLLTLQLNNKYIDFKAGIGGSEKLELHAASFKSDKELIIIDEVFKKISGGANIIANPSIGKHESFNTIITSYTNAMTNNIKDKSDADYINSLFMKHMPGHKMEVKEVAGRWSLVEGAKDSDIKFNALESFDNIINEMKTGETEFSKNFLNDVNKLEKDRISFMDIFTMQDNTIEKSQFDRNVGSGASLNHRSQSVMGMFIGDEENIADLEKYRDIKNGKYVSTWDAVIRSDIEQMVNDPKFVRGMEQSHNIRSAIGLSIGESGENI